ncbi:MAG: phosphatase PAP2 family protein [Gammaproteobacteria bacterium]|nr:phosphatase PAP2 family protein [Gammaproteobacteria bacterium]
MKGPQRLEFLALLALGLGLGGLLWLWLGQVIAVDLASLGTLDVRLEQSLRGQWSPAAGLLWQNLSRFGGATILPWVVALVSAGFFAGRRFFEGLLLSFGAATLALLVEVMKIAVDRPRPPFGLALGTPAFPSGHSSLALLVYGLIALLLQRQMPSRWLGSAVFLCLGALILGISWSRLGLGVHWLSDVLGGWVLAALWLFLLWLSWRAYRRRYPAPVLTPRQRLWGNGAVVLLTALWLAILLQAFGP